LHKDDCGAITHRRATVTSHVSPVYSRVAYLRPSCIGLVQFSSVVEDGRRGSPASRSLRTEQRHCRGRPEGLAGG
jgi:hypothetical protein